jgi:hypothetical protein
VYDQLRCQSDSESRYTSATQSDNIRNLPAWLGPCMAGRLDAKQLIIHAVGDSFILMVGFFDIKLQDQNPPHLPIQ